MLAAFLEKRRFIYSFLDQVEESALDESSIGAPLASFFALSARQDASAAPRLSPCLASLYFFPTFKRPQFPWPKRRPKPDRDSFCWRPEWFWKY